MKLTENELTLLDLAISAAIRALFLKTKNMTDEEVLAEIEIQRERKDKLMAQL